MTDVDSDSVGHQARFLALGELQRELAGLQSPRDSGRVVLIFRKVAGGWREILDQVRLSPDAGIPGDAWGRGWTAS